MSLLTVLPIFTAVDCFNKLYESRNCCLFIFHVKTTHLVIKKEKTTHFSVKLKIKRLTFQSKKTNDSLSVKIKHKTTYFAVKIFFLQVDVNVAVKRDTFTMLMYQIVFFYFNIIKNIVKVSLLMVLPIFTAVDCFNKLYESRNCCLFIFHVKTTHLVIKKEKTTHFSVKLKIKRLTFQSKKTNDSLSVKIFCSKNLFFAG